MKGTAVCIVAPHAGAGVEMNILFSNTAKLWVAPHAGAGVEIRLFPSLQHIEEVAPLTGCVN